MGAFASSSKKWAPEVKLTDLPAGEYLLRIDAIADQLTAARAVRFTVQ